MYYFYLIIWILVHFIYTWFVRLKKFCAALLKRSKNGQHSVDFTKLRKLPTHLGVIVSNFNDTREFYDSLAKLICWSLLANIKFISFYDIEGRLKQNEEKLKRASDRIKSEQFNKNLLIIWNSAKNGFTTLGPKIHVKIHGLDDGREAIVRIARNSKLLDKSQLDKNLDVKSSNFTQKERNLIKLNVDVNHLKWSERRVAQISQELRKVYEFPDPDLILYSSTLRNDDFGLYLFGYPPWQIRLTEFLALRTYNEYDACEFFNVLVAYGECVQRVGS